MTWRTIEKGTDACWCYPQVQFVMTHEICSTCSASPQIQTSLAVALNWKDYCPKNRPPAPTTIFLSRTSNWKYCLLNGGHFVQAPMCYKHLLWSFTTQWFGVCQHGISHKVSQNVLGWGLLNQFVSFFHFFHFSGLSNPCSPVLYHVDIWQMSL